MGPEQVPDRSHPHSGRDQPQMSRAGALDPAQGCRVRGLPNHGLVRCIPVEGGRHHAWPFWAATGPPGSLALAGGSGGWPRPAPRTSGARTQPRGPQPRGQPGAPGSRCLQGDGRGRDAKVGGHRPQHGITATSAAGLDVVQIPGADSEIPRHPGRRDAVTQPDGSQGWPVDSGLGWFPHADDVIERISRTPSLCVAGG